MHLAYLDDSGSDGKSDIVLFGAVLIPDTQFLNIESVAGVTIETLIPEDRISDFKEFHAADLFGGHGAFEGIPEEERFRAIKMLLDITEHCKLTFIYSAVDKKHLAQSALGSANPIDLAFRMCALGVEDWLRQNDQNGLALFIIDESSDKSLKQQFKTSFRSMRSHLRPPWILKRLFHVHDDLYFGDSTDSIGIQVADLCNYIVLRRLKEKTDVDVFYSIVEKRIICSHAEPEWSQYRQFFLCI